MEAINTVISEDIEKIQDSNQKDDQQLHRQISIKIPCNVIDQSIELLGSVMNPMSENDGPAVRSSARVIHKLRTPNPQPEKKEPLIETPAVSLPKTPSQTKPHVKVQWMNKERNYFFDALNEYGRDFEQIAKFINMKMKRKTSSEQDWKTKDHIRVMYNQLYQKASKYLKFSEDVKKPAQELYTLINYGEMKRKLVMSSEKSFLKLHDLVYKGSVTIRMKGKNYKIKTPSCRALRKLNQLEGQSIENVQLPQRIVVQFRPVNLKSWGYVQSLAQNPRIRMVSLPLQKRLASLLHTLQEKWQTNNSRMYQKYVKSSIQKLDVHKLGEDIVAQSETDMAQLKSEEPILRFLPPHDTLIHRPMVQLNELLSSFNICLNSYEERIGATTRGEALNSEKIAQIKDSLKHPSKRMRFDSASEKNNKIKCEEQSSCKISDEIGIAILDYKSNDSTDGDVKKAVEIKEEENSESKFKQTLNLDAKKDEPEEALLTPTAPVQPKTNEVDKPTTAAVQIISTHKAKKKDFLMNGNRPNKDHTFKPLIDEETLKKVRQGWTLANVGDLTIGDLYLMFGSDSRLVLEYDCLEGPEAPIETNGETNACVSENRNIGDKLKNLLSIANLMEGSTNPMFLNYFSNHICEKNSNENGNAEVPFKQPILNIAPRGKSNQSRWRNNQQQRVRPQLNPVKPGSSGNHVIRDLYQTPATVESQMNKQIGDKEDEYEKIIEDKIQGFGGESYAETTQSSMRSLLENLTSWNDGPKSPMSEGNRLFEIIF